MNITLIAPSYNNLKHIKNAYTSIRKHYPKVNLVLLDDGKGFNIHETKSNGIGLLNMKKRAEMIGGKYYLESNPTTGTKLTIEIPL